MRHLWRASCIVWLMGSGFSVADDGLPRSVDPRLKVELFAENPQIVTPTGIDVDHRGRVWAIESNTHFPPEGYKWHPSDRVLVMSDTDGESRADRIVVFTDGLRHAMSVALRPLWFPANDAMDARAPVWSVYIATRREIRLFHDDDGDDKADRNDPIVHLDTKGDYPHNGLAGIAFDALGWMYFGFGENLGADYKIIGSDGTTLSGGGEGGNLYRCRLDGSKLQHWATGFWNPHASAFDAFDRLFTVDNDPDSRPPCRLLHIIQGGDYGYRFRYGRKGLHPFTSWNGEIPGTLPMVAGTGEAPSGILAYESDGLPEEYIGNLLVTSWGDHRIDRFRLKPKGASFESLAEPLIVGGNHFRPVGIACAPDGSLYCTDWVLPDYNVHGRGRVWRIAANDGNQPATNAGDKSPGSAALASKSLSRRRTAAMNLRRAAEGREKLIAFYRNASNGERGRIEAAWALGHDVQSFDELWNNMGVTPEGRPEDFFQLAEIAVVQAAVENDRLTNDPKIRDLKRFLAFQAVAAAASDDFRASVTGRGHESIRLLISMLDPEAIWEGRLDGHEEFGPNTRWLRSGLSRALDATLDSCDAFVFSSLVTSLGQRSTVPQLLKALDGIEFSSARARSGLVLAGRIRDPKQPKFVERGLSDRSSAVQRLCIQWIGEERFNQFRPQIEAVLNDPAITADLFLATLAALEMLDGVPPQEFDKTPPGKYVLPILKDDERPANVRALALRMVDPNEPALDDQLLGNLLASNDPALRLEAVRTLQQSSVERDHGPLRTIAGDGKVDVTLRAEAIVGLARPEKSGGVAAESRELLLKLLAGTNPVLQREALRSLRGFVASDREVKAQVENVAKRPAVEREFAAEIELALTPSGGLRPPLAGELRAKLLEPVRETDDANAGRRTFYHLNGAGCFKCHTVNGRGGKIGPDLSTIGRSLSREKLVDSILAPSQEIAPQFVTWVMEMSDGKVHTGMIVHENEGKTILGDAEGKTTEIRTHDVVNRVPQKVSVMPEKLAERMTIREFRDLRAYLDGLK